MKLTAKITFQISLLLSVWIAPHISLQQQANITKRTLSEEGNYGNPTVWFYTENLKPQVVLRSTENGIVSSKPLAIVELQPVKIVEPAKEIPHSALYGIQQQEPTHLVRNIKQLLGPSINLNKEIHEFRAPGLPNLSPRIVTSETIVSPVQHNQVLTDHNNYAVPRVHPLFNTQPAFQIPNKKYAYVNGKIIYDSSDFRNHLTPPQAQPHTTPNLFPPQHLLKQELNNFHNFLNGPAPRASLSAPAIPQTPVVPEPSTKFEPPKPPAEPLPVTENPQRTYRKERKGKERPISEKDDSAEETEDDEEEEPYENEKQKGAYDEDDHQLGYKNDNEESEEENDNGSNSSKNRYVKSKFKKYPKKKYRNEYYNNDKYEYSGGSNWRKNGRKHKNYIKGHKFPKHLEEPDTEFSENVLVRKRKLLKEINFRKR